MNYIDQQEYKMAIQQLQYYQAIKEHYDLMLQEERTKQELDYLKRYANEVVYPAIDKARQVKEDYLRTREREEKSKQQLRDLKNAYKEYQYNRERRKYEQDRLVYDDGNGGGKIEFTLWRRLPKVLEERE
jgi:hypothetical protein